MLIITVLGANFAACQEKKVDEVVVESPVLTIPKEEAVSVTTVKYEDDSEGHFGEALASFDKNDSKTMEHLKQGIDAFKNETKQASGKSKVMADSSLTQLESLSKKLEKGEVKEKGEMEKVLTSAERAVAHTFIMMAEDGRTELMESDTTNHHFSRFVDNFEHVLNGAEGEAKISGEKLLEEGKVLEKKMETEERIGEKEVKDFYRRSKIWLEKDT